MGMDVFGNQPMNDKGEYFRNNVWWWRSLWEYCEEVAPELTSNVNGHFNDGDGLDEDGAVALSNRLFEEIESGRTEAYEHAYNAALSKLPRHECEYCGGTGIRTDEVGLENGMPTRELEPYMAVLTGRTVGYCNACQGEGMRDSFETNYQFSVDNVRSFAEFLQFSGGFQIW